MWRHGDVLIAKVDAMPDEVQAAEGATVAYGEITGHSHRFAQPNRVELFNGMDGLLYVRVVDDEATLVHEEHDPIVIPQGVYRVWQQREYTPKAVRRVVD